MKKIRYTIKFFSDWHCGSGLAAGADVDALVVKDKDRLPFVPGKTIKGLIREAVEDIAKFSGRGEIDEVKEENIEKSFGLFIDDKDKKEKGCMFFSNAELKEEERKSIVCNKLQDYLYRSVASTAIGKDGIAKDHSLRKMEVVVPCELEGEILDVPDNMVKDLLTALKYIKRLGVNRNRGLGRCSIEGKEAEK